MFWYENNHNMCHQSESILHQAILDLSAHLEMENHRIDGWFVAVALELLPYVQWQLELPPFGHRFLGR